MSRLESIHRMNAKPALTWSAAAAHPFDPSCRQCPRLTAYRDENQRLHPHYHNAPVDAFGEPDARLLIVGLGPGLHGANATGRPFTGDYAGVLLYQTLHDFSFSEAAESRHAGDGLRLRDCRITNALRCVPPQNRPEPGELRACQGYLRHDLALQPPGGVILVLGRVAHEAVLRALDLRLRDFPFAHGALQRLPDQRPLLSSYHCSRYNTATGRLTSAMFAAVMAQARDLLSGND